MRKTTQIRPSQSDRPRSAGRPRLIPQSSPDIDPREEILETAGRLFCAKGYEETSTREIALAIGLQQGSLFHYFTRKQDMLAELLDRTLQPAIMRLSMLGRLAERPEAKLYLLVWADVRNICSQPYNLGSLLFQPATRSPDFAFFWEKRARLRKGYFDIIEAGRREGVFEVIDSELTTDLVFGLVESAFIWFTPGIGHQAGKVADEVALSALRIVAARGSLAKVQAAARKIQIGP